LKILADENIPLVTIESLRTFGHDVLSLHDSGRKGMKDTPVWSIVQNEQRLLVTTDKGFARHRNERHYGILVVRLRKPNLMKIDERVLAALSEIPEQEWPGLLLTIRDTTKAAWKKK